jgi:hypothetical protein
MLGVQFGGNKSITFITIILKETSLCVCDTTSLSDTFNFRAITLLKNDTPTSGPVLSHVRWVFLFDSDPVHTGSAGENNNLAVG